MKKRLRYERTRSTRKEHIQRKNTNHRSSRKLTYIPKSLPSYHNQQLRISESKECFRWIVEGPDLVQSEPEVVEQRLENRVGQQEPKRQRCNRLDELKPCLLPMFHHLKGISEEEKKEFVRTERGREGGLFSFSLEDLNEKKEYSLLKVRTETFPSDEAHSRTDPSS